MTSKAAGAIGRDAKSSCGAASNVEASTKLAKQAKGVWVKHGAQDFRLSQIYCGQFIGRWLVSATFVDSCPLRSRLDGILVCKGEHRDRQD